MSAFVVITKNQKLISVQKNWIKNPTQKQKSLVFFSPSKADAPNFNLKPSYFFQTNSSACYDARILKGFGEQFYLSYEY